jgi:hypothetical protein
MLAAPLDMTIVCGHRHGFPVCACVFGTPLPPDCLAEESRRLSAHAGWPGPVEPEAVANVLAAEFARLRRSGIATFQPCNCGGRA